MGAADEPKWRETVRQEMEKEISLRVREALDTPPLERIQKKKEQLKTKDLQELNAHLFRDLSERERSYLRSRKWKEWRAKHWARRGNNLNYLNKQNSQMELALHRQGLSKSNHDEFPGVYGLDSLSEGIKNIRDEFSHRFPGLACLKPKRHFYTKEGFMKALATGSFPSGVQILSDQGAYVDKHGVIRNGDGPFWPVDSVPLFSTPRFKWFTGFKSEPLAFTLPTNSKDVDTQITPYKGRWRGIQIAYDSEKSSRDFTPLPVPDGCCPTLMFESRFECGNLRQARRVGQYEYELILKPDLYTARHTQWFYFRVTNTVPGVTYKFKVVNLLKRNSLYSQGMRPLVYSERNAVESQIGWVRSGHHISYSKNTTNLNSVLLMRGVAYYVLEWQMEFPNMEDTYYLSHCYPYSFTDLKDDLEVLINNQDRSKVVRREVMCETRAGNSCFLLTVTDFDVTEGKKAVVISSRVHPGESQASWLMKGVLEFITGPDPTAQELRRHYIFKIIPMINPDGVIVGNYRCSLAARDLNRNYRHPRRENFPTVWHLKNLMDGLSKNYEIVLYCDLHGHSRKPNVFMYGNNTSTVLDNSNTSTAEAFIAERMFPWLMSVRSPDKFSFKSCKFNIRRCKESTGRVVMWRQLAVRNSFTLEASFSGTMIDEKNCRHFNIIDFMEMGKVLAQSIWDFHLAQSDPMVMSQHVLDIARVVTGQILVSKGLLPPQATVPDFTVTTESAPIDKHVTEKAEKWTSALLHLLNTPNDIQGVSIEEKNKSVSEAEKTKEVPRNQYTKEDVVCLISKLTDGRNVDDCLNLLDNLDVQDAILESDSSDSDSESEPEMKPAEPKPKKKKRKSKKQRDKDNEKKGHNSDVKRKSSVNSDDQKIKHSHSLPMVSNNRYSTDPLTKEIHIEKYRPLCGSLYANAGKQSNAFISKYEGRSNGGLPCFTEERSVERAAKRLADLSKKREDDKNKELTFYRLENNVIPQLPTQDSTHMTANRDDVREFKVVDSGLNVRTSYTHAENFHDLPLSTGPRQQSYLLSTVTNGFPTSVVRNPSFFEVPYHSATDSDEIDGTMTSKMIDTIKSTKFRKSPYGDIDLAFTKNENKDRHKYVRGIKEYKENNFDLDVGYESNLNMSHLETESLLWRNIDNHQNTPPSSSVIVGTTSVLPTSTTAELSSLFRSSSLSAPVNTESKSNELKLKAKNRRFSSETGSQQDIQAIYSIREKYHRLINNQSHQNQTFNVDKGQSGGLLFPNLSKSVDSESYRHLQAYQSCLKYQTNSGKINTVERVANNRLKLAKSRKLSSSTNRNVTRLESGANQNTSKGFDEQFSLRREMTSSYIVKKPVNLSSNPHFYSSTNQYMKTSAPLIIANGGKKGCLYLSDHVTSRNMETKDRTVTVQEQKVTDNLFH